ncbi:MAG: hypothetical protein ABSH19_00255 [Opitutales bacterium]|jgi:hypothetical protein
MERFLPAVLILAYGLAVGWSASYRRRWGCAVLVTLMNAGLTVIIFFLVDLLTHYDKNIRLSNVPVEFYGPTAYLLLLAAAVVVRRVAVVNVLIVVAHIVLLAGLPTWDKIGRFYVFAALIVALCAPIWFLAYRAKSQPIVVQVRRIDLWATRLLSLLFLAFLLFAAESWWTWPAEQTVVVNSQRPPSAHPIPQPVTYNGQIGP